MSISFSMCSCPISRTFTRTSPPARTNRPEASTALYLSRYLYICKLYIIVREPARNSKWKVLQSGRLERRLRHCRRIYRFQKVHEGNVQDLLLSSGDKVQAGVWHVWLWRRRFNIEGRYPSGPVAHPHECNFQVIHLYREITLLHIFWKKVPSPRKEGDCNLYLIVNFNISDEFKDRIES